MKILRHISLNNNVLNRYGKFQLWVMHIKRVIHVQKIKVQKIIFKYISFSRKKLIINFHKLYTFRKASYSVVNTLKCTYVS